MPHTLSRLAQPFSGLIRIGCLGSMRRRMSGGQLSVDEVGRVAAATAAFDAEIEDGLTIGIGSGSTIVHGVRRLAERVKKEQLKVVCVPTSHQAKELIVGENLQLSSLDAHSHLDLAIDGCDEFDPELTLIKGGGGCHTMEKMVAFAAKRFVVIADESKKAHKLGDRWAYVPIEVIPQAHALIKRKMEIMLGGEVRLRPAVAKAGPVVSDNGNLIVDWYFDREHTNDKEAWKAINEAIVNLPGVVDTGLFVDMAHIVYLGDKEGNTQVIHQAIKD